MAEKLLNFFIERIVTHVNLSNVVVSLLALFILSAVVERLTNNGPMLWPVMGILPTVIFHAKDIYNYATKAFTKTGGTLYYRGIWMSDVHGIMTVDPSNIEYMLKTRFDNFPKGKFYRERFSDLLGDGIFNADGESWKEQKRVVTMKMHSKRFVEYSFKTMQDLVHQKLLKLLEKFVNSGESVDLQDILLRFTFDNICMAAFGVDPNCLAIELPDVPFAKAFEKALEITLFRFLWPKFVWKPMQFFCIGSEKKLKEAVRIVHEFAMKTVIDRRIECCGLGGLDNRSDLLSRLIAVEDSNEQGKNYQFSDKFLKDLCISFILAGRDTSSVALSWFFWLIYEHPHVEKRILDEICEILGERSRGEELNLNETVFTIDELKKMEYLQAVISESLRLYPPVPIDLKEAQQDDMFPNGSVVKKGAKVLYNIVQMGRIEAIWGKDCCEFKPERWIKDGKFLRENDFKFLVFNAGPRLCIGKKFAHMQMKMVAASILLRYSVKVVEGHVVFPKITTTLYMKNGLLVTFEPRFGLEYQRRSALSNK